MAEQPKPTLEQQEMQRAIETLAHRLMLDGWLISVTPETLFYSPKYQIAAPLQKAYELNITIQEIPGVH